MIVYVYKNTYTSISVNISLRANAAVRLRDATVIVGPGEPAVPDEPVEVVVDGPLPAEVGAVFAEAEEEDVDLPVAPR